ncbi:MAG TPA: hypothetical protein VLT58_16405 [Polyangia bacterium]|nr:hypothetical protein [Polyangia bacterium]
MDYAAQIRQRITELQQERATVVQQAAARAALPYDSALGELQRLLTLADAPTHDDKETTTDGTHDSIGH